MKNGQACWDNKAFIALSIVAIVALLLSVAIWNQLRLQESNLNTAYLRNAENQARLDCIDQTLRNYLPAERSQQVDNDKIKDALWDIAYSCNMVGK